MNHWKVDPTKSTVTFSVPHMMISKVHGTFKVFSGQLQGNIADLTKCAIQFQVTIHSIHTNNRERDVHLCSADFFDAQSFPLMTFTSRSIYADEEGIYHMTGELTIKETTKNILFCITPLEIDVFGACYLAKGEVKRKEFDLTWNRAIEAGGVMVGDTVDIEMKISVVKPEALR